LLLEESIKLAQQDWRDLLMVAGFAHEVGRPSRVGTGKLDPAFPSYWKPRHLCSGAHCYMHGQGFIAASV